MKVVLHLCVVLALVLLILGPNLTAQDSLTSAPVLRPPYELNLKRSRRQFKSSEPYIFQITLANKSEEEIYFMNTFDAGDFSFDIRDKMGRSVPHLVRDNHPKMGSQQVLRVGPKSEYSLDVDISQLFQLPPGHYTVTISRQVFDRTKRISYSVTTSKPESIIITR